MKIVTFTRDMRPYGAGDSLVVPDAMAVDLLADGAVCDVRPFPPAVAPSPEPAPKVALAADATPPSRPARRYMVRRDA